MGPLDGVRVLDFTIFQHGPHATLVLGDTAADLIQFERSDARRSRPRASSRDR
jgi:crotonobetainyl-CoA:carnitine CoA-transferase CaiB-like acyl-CoA transferase